METCSFHTVMSLEVSKLIVITVIILLSTYCDICECISSLLLGFIHFLCLIWFPELVRNGNITIQGKPHVLFLGTLLSSTPRQRSGPSSGPSSSTCWCGWAASSSPCRSWCTPRWSARSNSKCASWPWKDPRTCTGTRSTSLSWASSSPSSSSALSIRSPSTTCSAPFGGWSANILSGLKPPPRWSWWSSPCSWSAGRPTTWSRSSTWGTRPLLFPSFTPTTSASASATPTAASTRSCC